MATKKGVKEKQLEFSLDKLDGQSLVSLGLGILVVVVVGLLAFNYFTQLKTQPGEPEITREKPTSSTEVVSDAASPDFSFQPTGLPTTHVVQPKEHLWGLAMRYYNNGYFWVEIAKANKIVNPDYLLVGSELEIPNLGTKWRPKQEKTTQDVRPKDAITTNNYVVQAGDSLCKIARRAYGNCSRGWEIARVNKLKNPHRIIPGQELVIPKQY